ncbi:MAG: glycosyltransferase family 2 protein [Candidatus Zixiibacteriota bacterium]
MIKHQPRVHVIVLTWNRVEAVIRCLLSLNALDYSNYEVVVIDNHSEDGTVERLRSIFPRLDIIANERNLGYTGGNNVGIRHALNKGAEYIVMLNNDTLVHPDFISEMVKVAESDRSIAVVGSKNIMCVRPRIIWAAWGEITYGSTLTRIHGKHSLDSSEYNQIRDVDQVIGCGYMWRREALLDIGLLDTNFFGYHEDVDWCFRARKAGWRVVYVGSAIVYHQGGLSCSPGFTHCIPVMYFLGRNGVLFVRKHSNLMNLLRLTFNSMLGSIQRYRANRRNGGSGGELQFWQGFWDGLRNRNRQKEFRNESVNTK